MLSVKPWKELSVVRLILVVLGCLVGLSLTATLVGHWLGRSGSETPRAVEMVLGTFSLQAVVLLLVHFFLREHGVRWVDFLGLSGPRLGRALGWALGVGLVALPLTLTLNMASAWAMQHVLHLTPETQSSIKLIRISPGLGERIYFGLLSIVFAPLVEETIFRGILYPALKQVGYPKAALFGTALTFAAIHGNLMTFVPLMFLAVVLAGLYEITDNLLAPICMHGFFNAANFLLLIFEEEWKRFCPFGQ
jgi:membrane protease YdiL (CAAX protease family)